MKKLSKTKLILQGSEMVEIVLFHDRGSIKKCSPEMLHEPINKKAVSTMVIVKISMILSQGRHLLFVTSFPGRKKDEIIQMRLEPNVVVAHRLWEKATKSRVLSQRTLDHFHLQARDESAEVIATANLIALQSYVDHVIRR